MKAYNRLVLMVLLFAGGPAVSMVFAQSGGEESQGPRRGLEIGARGAYYLAKDADHGDIMQGAQARLHLTRRWTLEGSLDLRQDRFGGNRVDVIPLQLSVLAYLMPRGFKLAPYILAGCGWYYTRLYTQGDKTDIRFGPHAGGGIEYFFSKTWSMDGSYRYLWSEKIRSRDSEHPLGRTYSDEGSMLTAAVNYSF